MACQHVVSQRSLDPAAASTAHIDLVGTPHAAPLSRLFLREHLRGRVDPDVLSTVELLTTELIANVVLHARTGIHLGLVWDPANVVVSVQDDDPAGPLERHERGELSTSGRGLALITGLADDFGWARVVDGVGKVTWFALSLAAPVPRQAEARQWGRSEERRVGERV